MKPQTKKLLYLFLFATILMACSFTSSTVVPVSGGETPVGLTGSPASATASFTSTLPAPTQTPDPNAKSITFDNISFVIPGPLAHTATFKSIPAVTADKSQPWLIAPQHIQITLSGYNAPKGSYLLPQIFIYPAQDYANVNSGASASLQRLKTILNNLSALLTNDSLPWLPYTPGEQSIAAQTKMIAFKNGNGVRSVTQYDIFLDPVVTAPGDPIFNRLLFYHFEGLMSDGSTYIVAVLPLESPILANNSDPNASVPAGGIPYPGLGTDMAHFDYFKAVTDSLNTQSEDSFNPSLSLLDALIESITIVP
ncbi:MAG TPA: hypothetical protein VIN60_06000 [Anaerolineales bacterium]